MKAVVCAIFVGLVLLGAPAGAQNSTANSSDNLLTPNEAAILQAVQNNDGSALAQAVNKANDSEVVTSLLFLIESGNGNYTVQVIQSALPSLDDTSSPTPRLLVDWAVAVISSMEAAQNDTQYGLVGIAIESGIKAGGKTSSATLAALSQEQSSSGCNYVTNPVLAGNLVSQYEAQSGSSGASKMYCSAIQSVPSLETCVPELFSNSSQYNATACSA